MTIRCSGKDGDKPGPVTARLPNAAEPLRTQGIAAVPHGFRSSFRD